MNWIGHSARLGLEIQCVGPDFWEHLGELTPFPADLILAYEFHRGGVLDAQIDGASAAYANYVFGVYMAAAGYSLDLALFAANQYASGNSSYPSNIPMDPNYPATPASNVAYITEGYYDEENGTLCVISILF